MKKNDILIFLFLVLVCLIGNYLGSVLFEKLYGKVDRPAGAVTLWYLDGTVLRPVDPTWTSTVAAGPPASDSLNFDEFQNPLVLDANISVASGAFTWDWNGTNLLDIGQASVTKNFEVDGFASTSQYFGGVASHTFGGTVVGTADNTLTLGSSLRYLKEVLSKIVRVATKLTIPAASGGPTIDETGAIGVNTATSSFNFHDGTAERVLRSKTCFTYAFEAPTTTENWGNKYFDDPFTITEVTAIASGSNAVGWNILHGLPGSITTGLFSAQKSASTSFTYTSFSDATLANGEYSQLQIASASSTVENLDVTICGRYDP